MDQWILGAKKLTPLMVIWSVQFFGLIDLEFLMILVSILAIHRLMNHQPQMDGYFFQPHLDGDPKNWPQVTSITLLARFSMIKLHPNSQLANSPFAGNLFSLTTHQQPCIKGNLQKILPCLQQNNEILRYEEQQT